MEENFKNIANKIKLAKTKKSLIVLERQARHTLKIILKNSYLSNNKKRELSKEYRRLIHKIKLEKLKK